MEVESMRENMLENIDDFKVSEVCRRFDELKDLGYDEEKMIEDVLFDDDFGYCLEEEVYEIYEYWKKDRNYLYNYILINNIFKNNV
jgi:hypothetical protein